MHATKTIFNHTSVPFASDGGMLSLRRMGGHYRANAAYAQNSIGKAFMAAMIDEARKYEAEGLIERLSHHAFVQLLLADVPQVLSVGNLPLGMESGLEPIEGIFRRLVQGILHGQP